MNRIERNVIFNTSYGHFLSHCNMLVFPAVVIPLTQRLGISLAETLQLSLWMYMLLGLTALPWGLAADRWGALPLMRVYYVGAGASALAAAAWIDSPPALAASLAGIGLFSGIYHPAGLGLISKTIRRLSVALGITGMFGNLGMAAAPFIAGIVNWLWGPRAVYILLGGMNLAGLLLVRRADGEEFAGSHEAAAGEAAGWRPALALLLLAMMLGGIAYRGSTVIIPAYFELKLRTLFDFLSGMLGGGVSRNLVATAITSIIFLVGMAGQYAGGQVADRFDPRKGYLAFHLITIPAALLIANLSETGLVAAALVYFIFLLGMQPIENTLLANLTPRRFHHTAFGAKFILTFGIGALAVKMVGAIEGAWGIEPVFLALASFSVLLVLTIGGLIAVTGGLSGARTAGALLPATAGEEPDKPFS